ncbi:alkaline phosphatase family protein [Sphingomonas sp. ASY06-1R]|uniref:alkaline phosphatase family protein n=1 Tax=Sphingomonas sp. ASY06-1R TaxID=3445771 RepID=UPI003FA2BFB2
MVRAGYWVAAAWLIASASAGMTAKPVPAQPKLVVAISIDQFSDELFQRYRSSFTGGLKRLGDGIAFTGYQSHAATETCPGHSTILTGRHPAATGIVANTWYDAKSGKNVYCVAVPGVADPDARGPQNLRVTTFGDWLKQAQPRARVVSISGKDRAAIMLGGHKADAVYWWKNGTGFTTSSYAGPATAGVTAPATAFNQALFARWRTTPPKLWPAQAPAACQALEQPHLFGKLAVSGKVPPDLSLTVENGDFVTRADFQDQLHVSPIFDPMTLDFVDRTIDRLKLGHGPATDLLAVSLSSTDYIGHRYGNGGAEMCVQMHALDQALGAFLAKLDRLRVPYVVALTADHGGIDAAERASEHGIAAHRIDPRAFVKALNAALQAQFGLHSAPIAGDDPQQLTITVGPDEALRRKVRDAAVAWLKQRPEVAAVFTADQVAAAAPPAGKSPDQLTVLERFHESYDKERSGDIQVELEEYASVGMPHSPGDNVAGHGSPWDYDRRVPILFWWPGIAPEPRTEPIETVDIAPTLAAIVHVPTPEVDGKCLTAVAGRCR